jgi:dynein heavy chain
MLLNLAGLDFTPGGKDESRVPLSKKLNAEVELGERVQLLIQTVTSTLYIYISQVIYA